MKLYQLIVRSGEYEAEGKDESEWFTSLETAKRRRRQFIAQATADGEGWGLHKFGVDFEILEIVFAKLPPRELVRAVLNRRGYIAVQRIVVPAYSLTDDEP